ncbi:MAG TPA: response regulator transcription factor [Thioalkalivibrio sp.]|nr:response regulator transcription factor [Thioalkalivibrio sp.]
MKVLIVDDEKPARDRLRSLIDELPDFGVCAEAANGTEALREADHAHPDIVLMDVRMPGMDGIEAARHLAGLEAPPAVIFTTAFEEHALEAFRAHAAGYLVKPIRKQHLLDALAAARTPTRAQLAALGEEVEEDQARTHICARFRGNLELIPVDNIIYFLADQKYVTVRHTDGEVIIEEPLKSLEEEFGERFLRVHRNALVQRRFAGGMEKSPEGRFMIAMKGIDDRLEISRRHVAEVRRFLKSR